MNICLISKEYPPETGWGGIGTYTYNLAHALANKSNEVHVISMGLESNYEYFDQNVHVHRIKTADPHFVANCLIHTYQVLGKISKFDGNIDIIEAPEFRGEALATVLRSKIPMVTRLHTPSY